MKQTSHYQVLARRWRPRRFSELVGQEVVARTLKNALLGDTPAHAYLLTGIRGVGKTTIARLMAMTINCTAAGEDGEPCNQCAACTAIAAGNDLDVSEMDAASHTGVDDVRDLIDSARYPPASRRWRVFIIDEVHMLSRNAFNALLKTLEEPPAQVMFILATTDVERLPVTVRSRCQRFDLRRLSVAEIQQQLRHIFDSEQIQAEEAALRMIAAAADGSMRDALSLAERVLAFSREQISHNDVQQALGLLTPELPRQLTDAIIAGDAASALQWMKKAASRGYSPRALLEGLGSLWHQLACCRIAPEMLSEEPDEAVQQWMQDVLKQWPHAVLDLHYQVLLHGLRDLALVDEQCGAEMVVLRLCHLQQLTNPDSEKKKSSAPPRHEASRHITPPAPAIQAEAQQATTQQEKTPNKTPDSPAPPTRSSTEAGEARQAPLPSSAVCHDWPSAVAAYSELQPAFAALLEHVVCTRFDEKQVRLSLEPHQQHAIPMQERVSFERWLGRSIIWDNRHHDASSEMTISRQRSERHKAEQQRLWQHAREDPHIQALITALGCSLLEVIPPGMADQDKNN